jgi:hypothetical protein
MPCATPILNQQEEKLTLNCAMMPYSQIPSIYLIILYMSLRYMKFGTWKCEWVCSIRELDRWEYAECVENLPEMWVITFIQILFEQFNQNPHPYLCIVSRWRDRRIFVLCAVVSDSLAHLLQYSFIQRNKPSMNYGCVKTSHSQELYFW